MWIILVIKYLNFIILVQFPFITDLGGSSEYSNKKKWFEDWSGERFNCNIK